MRSSTSDASTLRPYASDASRDTISAYAGDLDAFAEFAAENGERIEAATAELVRAYLRKMARVGLAPTTAARKLSVLAMDSVGVADANITWVS